VQRSFRQDSANMLILFFQAIFAINMMISAEIDKNIDIIFNLIVSNSHEDRRHKPRRYQTASGWKEILQSHC
jgi:hypothetical protein